MAKASLSTQFRKVDVDELDENLFQDEQGEDGTDSGPNESEVNSLILQKNNKDALKATLCNPPIASKNQAAKDKAFNLVMRVLQAFKSSEIDAGLKVLDKEEVDILMRYIYRGFAQASDSASAILLTWHEKVVAIGGIGTIVRVMTDRKSV
ncbi:actin-related protein 2/3 complex subunit 5-A-like [Xenia sp. Carnegie-2017]|uniref:actin-related protein 2/3 complex subunit 5-A-like n=1 Tax=Xenia sp. Carnegie-2017 TaxID=2897299 RepID=UPI001F050111|nr:actin-related protein 2/3 complex subunit 5-A-like [Xenia sp. Carnegie-2017]